MRRRRHYQPRHVPHSRRLAIVAAIANLMSVEERAVAPVLLMGNKAQWRHGVRLVKFYRDRITEEDIQAELVLLRRKTWLA